MLTGRQPPLRLDERLLALAPGEQRAYERDEPVHVLFRRQVEREPAAIAVVDANQAISYAELDARAHRLAAHLRASGVRPGTTVGVALERSSAVPAVLLGILKAGAAYVPLDPSYPDERLRFMLDDTAAVAIVTTRALREKLPRGSATIVDLESDAGAIAAAGDGFVEPRLDSRALAYVTYTSGSTGRPKGVAVEHRGVVRLVRGTDYIEVTPEDAYLYHAPLAFDASTFEIWAPLLNGARLAVPRAGLLSMPELYAAIERFGVTTLFLTTSLFDRFVDGGPAGVGTLRHLLTGGEIASPAHMVRCLRDLPACRLLAVYGPTENTTFSTWIHLDSPESIGTNVPIGRPIAHSSAYVLDGRLQPVPAGVEGELCVGGDGVARGYVNVPELTAQRFVADPFSREPDATLYRTGDRARMRPDGVIEFLGRDDDQVKIRGFRVELGEIESALRTHGDVTAAAVVLATQHGEKALFAYVVPAAGAQLRDGELRAFLKTKLPPFALPHRITTLERLPEQASGKVDRVALARLSDLERPAAPAASQAPLFPSARRAAAQAAIAAAWRDALGLEGEIDPDLNFFDAGGDSLQILGLHLRLRRELGVDFEIMALFEHTTIRKLAAFLSGLPRN